MNLESHREAAFWENLAFLRECGLSEEAIAKRLNLTLNTLKKRKERHGTQPGSTSTRAPDEDG